MVLCHASRWVATRNDDEPIAFGSGLAELMADPELRARLASSAKAYVQREFLDREGKPVDLGNVRQGDLIVGVNGKSIAMSVCRDTAMKPHSRDHSRFGIHVDLLFDLKSSVEEDLALLLGNARAFV